MYNKNKLLETNTKISFDKYIFINKVGILLKHNLYHMWT